MSCGSARHGFETPRPEITPVISGLSATPTVIAQIGNTH
jgi:hypothetical protein